ncbi:MAG TPA: MAPEG family protein [Polyangiaceae bacterium]|nr:MAPEG family protein [Polyangiaceae bacterium]
MAYSLWSLLGFTVWTLLLVLLGIGLPRLRAVTVEKAAVNSFVPTLPHGSERYQRTMRAHMNCVENLPVFAALVLLAAVLRLDSPWFEGLALTVLPMRVLQSTTHVLSGRSRAVLVRFAFFTVQMVCFLIMAVLIALR